MSFYYRPSLVTVTSSAYNSGTPLILSDMSRGPVEVSVERIEQRTRMANGKMRSKFIADKRSFGLSWTMLPTRKTVGASAIISDGYASASDLKDFYDAVSGQFVLTMYADTGAGATITPGQVYGTYNVFFDSFSTTISKRGRDFDFHDVQMRLEEA